MIVVDASTIVCAALTGGGIPDRAVLHVIERDALALSSAVDAEIAEVLARPKFSRQLPPARRERIMTLLRKRAVWFEPTIKVHDCRDPDDNKYLELALTSGAEIIITSDSDLLALRPWHGALILTPAHFLELVKRP